MQPSKEFWCPESTQKGSRHAGSWSFKSLATEPWMPFIIGPRFRPTLNQREAGQVAEEGDQVEEGLVVVPGDLVRHDERSDQPDALGDQADDVGPGEDVHANHRAGPDGPEERFSRRLLLGKLNSARQSQLVLHIRGDLLGRTCSDGVKCHRPRRAGWRGRQEPGAMRHGVAADTVHHEKRHDNQSRVQVDFADEVVHDYPANVTSSMRRIETNASSDRSRRCSVAASHRRGLCRRALRARACRSAATRWSRRAAGG